LWLENRDYGHRDLLRWQHNTPLSAKVGTNFADKQRLLGIVRSWAKATELPYILESNPHPNLIRTSFLPPCIVCTARTPALSFGQTPALDRESNPHSILIRICPFSPLQL
jgi:hypothetical protein